MSDKKKFVNLVTPVATTTYAYLTKPDVGGKYSDGKYKVTLVLDTRFHAAQAFIDKVRAEADAGYKRELAAAKGAVKAKLKADGKANDPFIPVYDDQGDETGLVKFTPKTKRQPMVVDAKKNDMTGVNVGSGSKVKAAIALASYATVQAGGGVTMYLNRLQVLELVKFGGGGDPFDEEDGYEFDDKDATSENDADDADAPGDLDDF